MGTDQNVPRLAVFLAYVIEDIEKGYPLDATLLSCSQHKLNAIFLIYLGGAGILVYGQNIGLVGNFLNLINHAATSDMIGQAAKGLSANNIGVAAVHKLQHFCC